MFKRKHLKPVITRTVFLEYRTPVKAILADNEVVNGIISAMHFLDGAVTVITSDGRRLYLDKNQVMLVSGGSHGTV